MDEQPKSLVGFIMKGEEVVHTIWPVTTEDVVIGVGGEVRATDHDGEVHIIAAGEWTKVSLRNT